jgi:hypothetical protein
MINRQVAIVDEQVGLGWMDGAERLEKDWATGWSWAAEGNEQTEHPGRATGELTGGVSKSSFRYAKWRVLTGWI